MYLFVYLFIYLFIFYDKKNKSLKSQCLHQQHRYTTAFSQWIIEIEPNYSICSLKITASNR